jgi:hypothetical protein
MPDHSSKYIEMKRVSAKRGYGVMIRLFEKWKNNKDRY